MSTPHPRKKRPRDEEDDNDDSSPPPPLPPDGISPPGTKLRSGRKVKPRRSLEDRMNSAKKAKLTHHEEKDKEETDKDDDDDAEMEEGATDERMANDREMEEGDKDGEEEEKEEDKESASETQETEKPPAQEPAKAAPLPRGGRAARLRLPSQHTPGRPKQTTKKAPAAAAPSVMPPARMQLRKSDKSGADKNVVPAPPKARMNLAKTPHKAPSKASAKDETPPRKGDAAAEAQATGAKEAKVPPKVYLPFLENVEIPPWLDHSLSQPWTWFLVLGLLMLPRLFIVHPFLDSAVHTSRTLIPFYKGLLGSVEPPALPPVAKEELSEATRELVEQSEQLNRSLTMLEEEKVLAMEGLVKSKNRLDEQSEAVERQLEALEAQQTALKDKLSAAVSLWQSQSDELTRIELLSRKVLTFGKDFNPEDFLALQNSLGETERGVLLNTLDLNLWNPTLETCDIPDLTNGANDDEIRSDKSVIITKEFVMESWRELEKELDSEFRAMKRDKQVRSDIIQWIEDYVDSLPLPEYEEPDVASLQKVAAGGGSSKTKQGLSADDIRVMVEERLELERADGADEPDYAALYEGSAVIRSGPHATSPSIADRLPLFNRLMALMGSQFYGYGPEAALTPSYPPDALGHCWAFGRDESSNHFGSYAVLTVKLAEPIHVGSVAIEHVLSESERGTKSAIQNFRLFGYAEEEAATDPIPLGEFSFEIDQEKGLLRKEFEIDEDEDAPEVGSISLVIDSTRGEDYACLYRFRVHGRD